MTAYPEPDLTKLVEFYNTAVQGSLLTYEANVTTNVAYNTSGNVNSEICFLSAWNYATNTSIQYSATTLGASSYLTMFGATLVYSQTETITHSGIQGYTPQAGDILIASSSEVAPDSNAIVNFVGVMYSATQCIICLSTEATLQGQALQEVNPFSFTADRNEFINYAAYRFQGATKPDVNPDGSIKTFSNITKSSTNASPNDPCLQAGLETLSALINGKKGLRSFRK